MSHVVTTAIGFHSKWPQKQSQSIQFQKFSGGACHQTPLALHVYVSDLHVSPLLKILATGLYPQKEAIHYKTLHYFRQLWKNSRH